MTARSWRHATASRAPRRSGFQRRRRPAVHGLHGGWLAYEFWTQEFLGTISDRLTVQVPSHESRVIALRRRLDRPQFLGWNRQITMGGTLLEAVTWDPATAELRLRATNVTPGTIKASSCS